MSPAPRPFRPSPFRPRPFRPRPFRLCRVRRLMPTAGLPTCRTALRRPHSPAPCHHGCFPTAFLEAAEPLGREMRYPSVRGQKPSGGRPHRPRRRCLPACPPGRSLLLCKERAQRDERDSGQEGEPAQHRGPRPGGKSPLRCSLCARTSSSRPSCSVPSMHVARSFALVRAVPRRGRLHVVAGDPLSRHGLDGSRHQRHAREGMGHGRGLRARRGGDPPRLWPRRHVPAGTGPAGAGLAGVARERGATGVASPPTSERIAS
jgi:hypothetical protein